MCHLVTQHSVASRASPDINRTRYERSFQAVCPLAPAIRLCCHCLWWSGGVVWQCLSCCLSPVVSRWLMACRVEWTPFKAAVCAAFCCIRDVWHVTCHIAPMQQSAACVVVLQRALTRLPALLQGLAIDQPCPHRWHDDMVVTMVCRVWWATNHGSSVLLAIACKLFNHAQMALPCTIWLVVSTLDHRACVRADGAARGDAGEGCPCAWCTGRDAAEGGGGAGGSAGGTESRAAGAGATVCFGFCVAFLCCLFIVVCSCVLVPWAVW